MDYKEYLRKLEENKKYYIEKYGKDTYNRYHTYYSTKASGVQSEYIDRMDKLMENQNDYIKRYGAKTVDRYMSYYSLKSTGLEKASPSMKYLDKMMDNQNDYIKKYGEKEFDEYFNFYSSNVNKELGKAYKVIEKNPYSTRVFELNPQLAELFTYTDDEEDVLRQILGYAPKSFDKAAKNIVKDAREHLNSFKKGLLSDEEYGQEIINELMSVESWEKYGTKETSITEEQLIKAIQVMNIVFEYGSLQKYAQTKAFEMLTRKKEETPMQESQEPVQELQEPKETLKEWLAQSGYNPDEYSNAIIIISNDPVLSKMFRNAIKDDATPQDIVNKLNTLEQMAKIEKTANQLLENNINAINEYYDKEAELIKSEYDLSAINTYVPVTATNGNVVKSTSGNPVMALSAEAAQAEINSEKMNERIAENEKAREQALKDAPYLIEEQKTALQLAQQAAADPEFQNNIDDYVKQFDTEIAKQTVMGGELIEKIDPELLKKMFKDDPNSGYTYMTNEEKAVYQYYKETDSDKADKFYKSIVRTLNARAAQATSERIKEAGSTVLGDIGLAIASIIVAPLQAKALIGSGLDALGEYSPADPNKPYNAPAQFVSQARQEVTKDMSPVAAFFTNTAMSGADMAVALGTGGTSAAPFVMASSAAGATANDMLQRGGSYGQAFFGGLATGAIEFATESISFGHLGKIQKGFKDLSAKQIAKNIASQAGIEGLEEVIAEIGGTISDNLIMGEKSNYNLSVKQYMAQGMTEAEAVKKTNMDFFGKQLMASFVGGALLGGVFGAGETLSNVRTNTKIDSAMEAAGIDVDSMTDAQLAQAREDFYNEAMKAIEQNDIQTTPDGQIDTGTIPDVEGLQAEAKPQQAAIQPVQQTIEAPTAKDTTAQPKTPVQAVQSATAQNIAVQNTETTQDTKYAENAKWLQDIDSLNESILSNNVKESKLVKTIKENLNIKTPIDAEFKAKLASMESLYRVTDNKTQKRIARQFVDNNFEYAERYIKESAVLQTAADAAIISEIIERYRQTGRADEALTMIRQTAVKFSKAGQHVQSAAIWAKMTPEGAIKGIEQSIEKMNKAAKKQFSMSEQDAQYVMDNVAKLDNLNAPELANLFIEISKKRNRNLGKSTKAELEYLVSQNDISTLKDAVYQNLVLSVLDKVPRSLGRKISTIQAFSHLINPRTIIRNVFSNTLFKYQEMVSDYSAAIFDMLISLKTKQRTVAMPIPRNVKQNFEASKNYARRANFEIQTGIHLDDTQGKYELFALETFTALNNKVLNKIEKLLGYVLKTPDQFAKGAVEISEIRRQLALMGKNVQGKTIEELFEMADNETLTIAKQKASYNLFQDEGFIAGFLQSAKKLLNKVGLNKGDWGLGDLSIKYTRFPGNIIQRAIDYTPLGALKVLKYIGTKNLTRTQQRDIAQTFGRAITGTTMIWIGSLLSQLGIIISPPDENKREKDFFKDAGLTGRQINISAIERLIEGKDVALQEGDHFLSFDFLETINPHLSMGHELAKATDKQYTADKIAASVSNTFFDEILDLPTMYIINSMVYAGQKEDSTFIDVVSVPFTQAIPGFIPAPLRQAVSAADSTQRERKGWADSVILNTPWRETLPPSLGTFGQKKKQDAGILTFFNPGRSSTYLPLGFTKELKRLADKYGDYEVYPSGTKVKKFNRNGKTYELSEKEQQEFMVLYGDILADYYDIVLSSNLTDEEKIKKLKKGQTEIKDMVKDNYLFKKGIKK